jgi:hypothetical protein
MLGGMVRTQARTLAWRLRPGAGSLADSFARAAQAHHGATPRSDPISTWCCRLAGAGGQPQGVPKGNGRDLCPQVGLERAHAGGVWPQQGVSAGSNGHPDCTCACTAHCRRRLRGIAGPQQSLRQGLPHIFMQAPPSSAQHKTTPKPSSFLRALPRLHPPAHALAPLHTRAHAATFRPRWVSGSTATTGRASRSLSRMWCASLTACT